MAEQVLRHFQDQLLVTIVFGLLAGFLASKTVSFGQNSHLAFFLAIGLLGSFIGQFAMLYFNVEYVIGNIPQFRLFFDLLFAYLGSFLLASIIHFIKPL